MACWYEMRFPDSTLENSSSNEINSIMFDSSLIEVNWEDFFNTKKFIGYGNEAPWATSFSEEIGYIDNESLQQYFDFYLTGGIYNADDWRSQGSLKPSIKLTFWYEFLLRLTKNGKKVFVIPKLGLKHYVDREGSLYDEYRKTITEEESNWWYELAQKEQYYLEDRNKTFENRKGE